MSIPSKQNYTPFNESIVAEFSPLIELDSSNGLSEVYRDTITETNGGTVTNSGGQFVLSTSATANSVAGLRTKERGRYQPGIEGVPGVGFRFGATPTGNQELIAGYFDDVDGVWIGIDATGFFVRFRSASTTSDKIYQSSWNGEDKLDGNGPSGVKLRVDRTYVLRMPFIWYFGGPCNMMVQTETNDGKVVFVNIHNFAGPRNAPFFSNPKLPINAQATNGATESDIKLYIGGRQFAVLGRYNPNRRSTPQTNTGVTVTGSTTEPLITFRKKSATQSASKSVKVSAASLITDKTGILKIYIGTTLSAGTTTFGALSEVVATETALEVNTAATAFTGGTLIKAIAIGSSPGVGALDSAGIDSLGLDLPEGVNATLAFQNLEGTDATVSAVFEIEEEW